MTLVMLSVSLALPSSGCMTNLNPEDTVLTYGRGGGYNWDIFPKLHTEEYPLPEIYFRKRCTLSLKRAHEETFPNVMSSREFIILTS
jgi:hypothetical protein